MTASKLRTRGRRLPDDAILPPVTRIPPAAFDRPGPSCLGGAHRRCLLTVDECSCPCHWDPNFAARAANPCPARATYRCPACAESYPTAAARAGHLSTAHPIGWKPAEDLELPEPALPPIVEPTKRCPYCTEGFWNTATLAFHITLEHSARSVTATTAGTAAVPECTPIVSALGKVPGTAAHPVNRSRSG